MKLMKTVMALAAALAFASVPAAFAARADISVQNPVSLYGAVGAGTATLSWSALDASNKNSVTLTGKEILLFKNTDASSHTVTITSTADDLGRTLDIGPYTVSAGGIAFFGPVPTRGFIQASNSKLYFESDSALVSVAIVRLK